MLPCKQIQSEFRFQRKEFALAAFPGKPRTAAAHTILMTSPRLPLRAVALNH